MSSVLGSRFRRIARKRPLSRKQKTFIKRYCYNMQRLQAETQCYSAVSFPAIRAGTRPGGHDEACAIPGKYPIRTPRDLHYVVSLCLRCRSSERRPGAVNLEDILSLSLTVGTWGRRSPSCKPGLHVAVVEDCRREPDRDTKSRHQTETRTRTRTSVRMPEESLAFKA